MIISTTSAAARLGVSRSVIHKMVTQGVLTDHGRTAKGKSRHEFKLDSTEVREFNKTHVRRGRKWVRVENGDAQPTNGKIHWTQRPENKAKVVAVTRAASAARTGVQSTAKTGSEKLKGKLFSRFDALEQKMDRLQELQDRLLHIFGE